MRRAGLALAVVLVSGSCDLAAFDVTQNVPTQTIPGSSTGTTLPVQSVLEVDISLSSSDLPTGIGFVTSVTLKSATFTITSPPQQTFNFIQGVSLSIAAPSNQILATETPIATGQGDPSSSTLKLQPVGNVNLLPYLRAGAIVHARGMGTQPTDTTTLNGQIVLTVHP